MTSGIFAEDTQIESAGEGWFDTDITDRWSALGGGPNGGYLLSICARALSRVMPFPDPFVVSAFYPGRTKPGSARISTEVARSGRRHSTGEARLFQGDREAVRVIGTFGDLQSAAGRTEMFNEAPDLPAPDSCVDPMSGGGPPGVTIAERVDYRLREMPGWAIGRPTGKPRLEFWMRFKDTVDHDPLALLTLVDAAAPAVLELGVVGSTTVEMNVQVRARPVPGWLACRVSTRHVIDGYHEEDVEIWDREGKLAAQSRQFALLP